MSAPLGVILLGMTSVIVVLFFIATHILSGLQYLNWYRREGMVEHRSRTHNGLALCLGALLVLAGYAIHSMLDFNLHLPANLIPVAFAFAILANPAARSFGRRNAPAALVSTLRFAAPICGLLLLVAGFFYSRAEWHLEQARQIELAEYSELIARLDKALQ